MEDFFHWRKGQRLKHASERQRVRDEVIGQRKQRQAQSGRRNSRGQLAAHERLSDELSSRRWHNQLTKNLRESLGETPFESSLGEAIREGVYRPRDIVFPQEDTFY